MRRSLFCVQSVIFSLMLIATAGAQTVYQEIQLGKQALDKGKLDEAVGHFDNAASMVPDNPIMQLDLANALARKYVPGSAADENQRIADQAVTHYQRVLAIDGSRSASLSAAKGIAFLDAQMSKFDESKDYYNKAKQFDPRDAEPYYYVAVIDWTLTSQFRQQERTRLKLKPEDSLVAQDSKVCAAVKGHNWTYVTEAIDNLNKALELQPHFEDAMNYMKLMYQERADIECDDLADRKLDLKAVDDWSLKLAATKKANASRPAKKDDDDD